MIYFIYQKEVTNMKKVVDFQLLCKLAQEVDVVGEADKETGELPAGCCFAAAINALSMDCVPMSDAVVELGKVLNILY